MTLPSSKPPLIDYCWSYPFHGSGSGTVNNLGALGTGFDFVMPATVTSPPSAGQLSYSCAGTALYNGAAACTITIAPIVTPDILPQLTAGGYQYVIAYPIQDNGNGRALVIWNSAPNDFTPVHQGIARLTGMSFQNQFGSKDWTTLVCAGSCLPSGSVTEPHDNSVGSYIAGLSSPAFQSTVRAVIQTAGTGGSNGPVPFAAVVTDDWLRQTSTPAPSGGYAASATAGTGYSSSGLSAAAGGFAPYVWSVSAGALPAGLSVDPSNGTLSGAPIQTGTFTFTVKVTDALGIPSSNSPSQSVTVAPASVTASFDSASVLRHGEAISGHLSTSLTSPTWSFPASPALPLTRSGSTFSGTAPSPGSSTTYTITPAASIAGYSQAASVLSLTVKPDVSIAAPSTVFGNAGNPVSWNAPAVSNGIGAISYGLLQAGSPVTIGALCPGLVFSTSTGAVTGTPSQQCSPGNLTIQIVRLP